MNVAVIIPVHGSEKRLELARRVLLYYETLDIPGVNILTCPVLDDDGSDDFFCSDLALQFCGYNPNDASEAVAPGSALGFKFNQGIKLNRSLNRPVRDGVMIVGSDDLIAPAVFERIRDERPYYQEIRGAHFYNAETGEMVFAWKSHCGAGKYFSRAFLDTCDWRPYDDEANKNVDNGPSRFLPNGGDVMQASANRPLCIDIKCFGENMTAWSIVSGYMSEPVDKAECFKAMDDEWEARWHSPRT